MLIIGCSTKGDVNRNISPAAAARLDVRVGIQPLSLTRRFSFCSGSVCPMNSAPRTKARGQSGFAILAGSSRCRDDAVRFLKLGKPNGWNRPTMVLPETRGL
jgi:hypothetical protein